MKTKIKFIACLLIITAAVYKTAAANNKSVEGKHSLNKIVVTEEKPVTKHQTGDIVLKDSSTFHTVITKTEFSGKFSDLSDLIEKKAGVQVKQSGGLGSFSSVSLRGASSQQVLVFMDGILLNNGSGGGVDLSNISLDDVESIEIYRGITPVNFGVSSIGGAINIRTGRNDKKGVSAGATAGYGSFDTRKASFFINHKPGAFDYFLSGDFLSSDNDFKIFNDNDTEYNFEDDRWENRKNSQFKRYNLLVKSGFDFRKDVRIDVSNQFFSKVQGLPDQKNLSDTNTRLKTMQNISFVKYTLNNLFDIGINTSGRADFSYTEEEYIDIKNRIGLLLGQQHSRYKTIKYGYNHFIEMPTEYNIFIFDIDYHREKYRTTDLLKNIEFHSCYRNTASAALEDTILLLNEDLLLKPHFRYSMYNDQIKKGANSWGNELAESNNTSHYYSPGIGLLYRGLDHFEFKINVAKYVREPDFFERFGDRGFFIANNDLKAETGINFDTGYEVKFRKLGSVFKHFSFTNAFFMNHINDAITYAYDARGIGQAENVSRASIYGIEASVNTDITEYSSLSLNYTWQKPVNHNNREETNGNILAGRCQHSFFSKFSVNFKYLKIYAEYMFESGMYYDSTNIRPAAIKHELNSGAEINAFACKIMFDVKNILNKNYEDFNSYPVPGRSYYLSVSYEY